MLFSEPVSRSVFALALEDWVPVRVGLRLWVGISFKRRDDAEKIKKKNSRATVRFCPCPPGRRVETSKKKKKKKIYWSGKEESDCFLTRCTFRLTGSYSRELGVYDLDTRSAGSRPSSPADLGSVEGAGEWGGGGREVGEVSAYFFIFIFWISAEVSDEGGDEKKKKKSKKEPGLCRVVRW